MTLLLVNKSFTLFKLSCVTFFSNQISYVEYHPGLLSYEYKIRPPNKP